MRTTHEPSYHRNMTTATVAPATMDTRDAARYLGVAYQTLHLWRVKGRGPAYLRLGRLVRYRHTDLDAWLESRREEPGG